MDWLIHCFNRLDFILSYFIFIASYYLLLITSHSMSDLCVSLQPLFIRLQVSTHRVYPSSCKLATLQIRCHFCQIKAYDVMLNKCYSILGFWYENWEKAPQSRIFNTAGSKCTFWKFPFQNNRKEDTQERNRVKKIPSPSPPTSTSVSAPSFKQKIKAESQARLSFKL